MALHVPKAPGFAQMLKEGARHYSGLEEAVFRNIHACKQFADTVRTAYGPNGMNKIIINHIEKLFVTNDAATIIKELEVEHPAAKIIILASQMQEQEVGDGTNFIIILAGALLQEAEDLLRMGLTPTEITLGYELAAEKALEILPSLVCYEVKDYKNKEQAAKGIKTSIMSKQFGNEEFLSNLITDACISILPEDGAFNVDSVRVCKILGSGLQNSSVVHGMVFKKNIEGTTTKKGPAKVAVFTCPVDIATTETTGTVLIKSADELMKFSRGEENLLEEQIKSLSEAGVDVVVAGGKFGDLALHYMNKYNMMAVSLQSKFDVRRVSKTVNATALPKVITPSKEELGYADSVYIDELGDTPVVVFKQNGNNTRVSTIVIRGATDNYMDDIERAIDDGVNTFKGITRDGRFVPGAGATEIELALKIAQYGDSLSGLEQYSVKKFATALESFVKTLAENTGVKAKEVISKLYATHNEGKQTYGFDIEGEGPNCIDASEAGILDLYLTKYWGLKYATQAACTVLQVDQIILAKRAGGPKPQQGPMDDD
ncbi:T-complex protein 1 subunit theta [Planococcus citri]|uniref:T-complex protein 1 subunit theta n=1 Tax=Planococcus citri TaxID=170843 RepID=UPI0031F985AD